MATCYVIFCVAENGEKDALAVASDPETGWSEVERRAKEYFRRLQADGFDPSFEVIPEDDEYLRMITVDDECDFFMEEVPVVEEVLPAN